MISIELNSLEATVIMQTVGLMYCGGPPYYQYPKLLSEKEKDEAMSCWRRICDLCNITVYGTKEFTNPIPLSDTIWQKKAIYSITPRELELFIEIFDTTLKESQSDNYEELRIITGFPSEDVFHCFEILKRVQEESVQK